MKKVSAHQPNFLPWAGFFHKLISADIFVICAAMQYVRRGYANRVRMADNDTWATIPVAANFGPSNQIRIAEPASVQQIGRRITHWSSQKKYPYRARLVPIIDRLQRSQDEFLSDLNIDLIRLTMEALGHKGTEIVVDTKLNNADDIPKFIPTYGNIYLSGSSGPEYLKGGALGKFEGVYFQQIARSTGPETVLHLIARETDPIASLTKAAIWRSWPDYFSENE